MVTKTLNKPLAILSVTSSMSASPARGSLSFSYVLFSSPATEVTAAPEIEVEVELGVCREGEREKREGERTRKSRC